MLKITITGVLAREIIDSRGNPTVEAEIYLSDGNMGRAAVPSGASTGRYEALELRDMNPDRYMGRGVKKAVDNINMVIRAVITGMDIMNLKAIDGPMPPKTRVISEPMRYWPYPWHVRMLRQSRSKYLCSDFWAV